MSEIVSVQAFADRPPRLRIESEGREPFTLMVLSKRTSTMVTSDTAARDEAVAQIQATLKS